MKLTDEEKFQKLGEGMLKGGWDMKTFAVASEIRDCLKNMNDIDTSIDSYLNILLGSVSHYVTINDQRFAISVTYVGKNEKSLDGESA